jgi:hypothetical protein
MSHPSFLDQLFAREPRTLVRFPDVPVDQALSELSEYEEALASLGQAGSPAAPTPASAPAAMPEALGASLCQLATHVWRTRAKLVDAETGQPREENKRVYRHVEGAMESLGQMGLTMNDWMNQPYDAGLPVKVISFQPTPGLTRDTIVEVVKPTVIWNDTLLQLGEVVVGVPPQSDETTTQ